MTMAAISIERTDFTASQLRGEASRARNGAIVRRLLALALVLEGADRASAARTCGMDRQTLRDWVHRYNDEGLTGLKSRQRSGRPPKLTAEQRAAFREIVENGPDPERHKVVRWRCRDLREEIAQRFGVAVHERTVGKFLADLGYCRLSVRPQHPKSDEAAQEVFKKTSPRQSPSGCPKTPNQSPSKSGSRTRRASARKAR